MFARTHKVLSGAGGRYHVCRCVSGIKCRAHYQNIRTTFHNRRMAEAAAKWIDDNRMLHVVMHVAAENHRKRSTVSSAAALRASINDNPRLAPHRYTGDKDCRGIIGWLNTHERLLSRYGVLFKSAPSRNGRKYLLGVYDPEEGSA